MTPGVEQVALTLPNLKHLREKNALLLGLT